MPNTKTDIDTPPIVGGTVTPNTLLLAGASGGIGHALMHTFQTQYPDASLITLSRSAITPLTENHYAFSLDLTNPLAVNQLVDDLKRLELYPDWVIHCCGNLHSNSQKPEKSLQQMDSRTLHSSLDINVLSHVHVAQALDQILPRKSPLLWASISAQIGSIEDNRLGGWYAYRMSKAALNMWVKTLSIEWQRKHPHSCVIAVHPGTTDTALTLPFQANIPAEQLSTPEKTAKNLLKVLSTRTTQDTGQFFNYLGEELPW